jgi:F-type H+-transporting ATPase subunit a
MILFNYLQEHGAQPAGHAAEAAGHGGGHGGHVPWLVDQVNHFIGPAVFAIQQQVMPPIYGLFDAVWPGAGKSFEEYVAAGNLPIPTHVVMFLIVVAVAVVVLTFLRGKLSVESPTTRQQSFEVGVEAVRGLLRDVVGPHGLKYFPVVATFGLLILLSNLLGLVPDMVPPTANFNVTLALGVSSFLYYNYVGIRENGLGGHLKHFMGPVPAIAFMMLPIELISNSARILSLSLRLFGNIYGEEQVSGAISGLVPWVVPALLFPLTLFTSVLQTFIFIMLSMVYLGEVSHHAEGHDEHAHGKPVEAH